MFPFITALYLCPGTPWPWHVKKVLKRVAVEQIISQLPARTMEWVQRHQPDSLTKAIQLEQDQMSPGTQQASETPPTPVMQCKRLLVPGFCSPAFKEAEAACQDHTHCASQVLWISIPSAS